MDRIELSEKKILYFLSYFISDINFQSNISILCHSLIYRPIVSLLTLTCYEYIQRWWLQNKRLPSVSDGQCRIDRNVTQCAMLDKFRYFYWSEDPMDRRKHFNYNRLLI